LIARLLFLALVLSAGSASAAEEVVTLTTDKKTHTDGYWNTDQGYFVGSSHGLDGKKDDEAGPGLVAVSIGLVHGSRLHPGPHSVGGKELGIIGPMWLVIREKENVVLRTPITARVGLNHVRSTATHGPGSHVHMRAEFNATKEMLPKLEIEFEEKLKSGSQKIRVPLKSFMDER